MDVDIRNKLHKKIHSMDNDKYSRKSHKDIKKPKHSSKIPNGFLEDWSSNPSESSCRPDLFIEPMSKKRVDELSVKKSDIPLFSDKGESSAKKVDQSVISAMKNSQLSEIGTGKFVPVSMSLLGESDMLLNKENLHTIRFTTGMLEGQGISIDNTGTVITFKDDGSYRFDISGEGIIFSSVDVELVFNSDSFLEEVLPFTKVKIPRNETKLELRGIPTVLPIRKNQTIKCRLISLTEETVKITSGIKLLINRVV